MDKYLTEKEAAEICGLSRQWFQRARWEGNGPPFVKIGSGRSGAVRYRLSALLQWLADREFLSTSETR